MSKAARNKPGLNRAKLVSYYQQENKGLRLGVRVYHRAEGNYYVVDTFRGLYQEGFLREDELSWMIEQLNQCIKEVNHAK